MDLDALRALLRRAEWMLDAACAEHPELDWFPRRRAGSSLEPHRLVCAGCLVRSECAGYALEQGPALDGIWAGSTPQQRRTARVRGLDGDGLIALVDERARDAA